MNLKSRVAVINAMFKELGDLENGVLSPRAVSETKAVLKEALSKQTGQEVSAVAQQRA